MFKEYFGVRLEFDHSEVDRIIETHIRDKKPGYVVSLDLNNLTLGQESKEHLNLLNQAIVCNVDSSWLPTFVNWIYHTDYTFYRGDKIFLDYIKKGKYRQMYLGPSQKVLDSLKKEMTRLDPKVADMSFVELPFCKVEEFDYEGIARMINEDKPDIIWVSLGCPKQEQFMQRLQPFLNQGVMFGFGAILNFYSGLPDAEKPAPQWMVNMKLQFLHRLFQNPKKQWARTKHALKALPKAIREERKRAKAAR